MKNKIVTFVQPKYKLVKTAFGAASVVAGSAFSTFALAVDDAAVSAAQTAGEASVLNATNGLLAIIAVIVGISLVLTLLKKA